MSEETSPNEGARLLAVQGVSMRIIAERTRASKSTVHAWMRGRSTPSPKHRRALREHFGVPETAWERAADAGAPSVPYSELSYAEQLAASQGVPTQTRPERRAPGRDASPLAALQHQLTTIGDDLHFERLTAPARSRLRRDEIRAMVAIHEIEERVALTNPAALFAHPKFRRTCRAVIGALEEHPAAKADTVAALRRLGLDERHFGEASK